MTEEFTETLSPELCAGKILEISGTKFDPEIGSCVNRRSRGFPLKYQ